MWLYLHTVSLAIKHAQNCGQWWIRAAIYLSCPLYLASAAERLNFGLN